MWCVIMAKLRSHKTTRLIGGHPQGLTPIFISMPKFNESKDSWSCHYSLPDSFSVQLSNYVRQRREFKLLRHLTDVYIR